MEVFWYAFKAIYTRWGSQLTGKHDKACAYGFMTLLLLFSILDTVFDWKNCRDLLDRDYKYSIATGPPDPASVKFLLLFTVIGTLLCVFEIINAFSLMCNGGHTKVDVEVEQMVTIVLCQIPQAAINLAICLCRNNHLTNHQSVSLLMTLINVTFRLYIYGCTKEKVFSKDRPGAKQTFKMALYVTASVLWMFMFMTQVFMWDHGRVTRGHFMEQESKNDLMKGVSVSLVREATHTESLTNQYHSYNSLWKRELRKMKPWIVRNITDIYDSKAGVVEYYECNNTAVGVFQPSACSKYNATSVTLKFKFLYHSHPSHLHINPLGEILYNYASLINNLEDTNDTLCQQSTGDLQDGWHLKYYRFKLLRDKWLGPILTGHKAWKYVCITPVLRYKADIPVC